MRRPPSSTLFPYTTLFRSRRAHRWLGVRAGVGGRRDALLRGRGLGLPHRRRRRPDRGGEDRKSTRSELQSQSNLVCRLLLEKKNPIQPGLSIICSRHLPLTRRPYVFFFHRCVGHRVLHSFPTRRSSDLVVLTGGSAFGLASADGVMRFCEAEGSGYPTAGGVVPIVVAKIGRAHVLNSSHSQISYAVFCLKKKTQFNPDSASSARAISRSPDVRMFFFFTDASATEFYTLSLHDALPISSCSPVARRSGWRRRTA